MSLTATSRSIPRTLCQEVVSDGKHRLITDEPEHLGWRRKRGHGGATGGTMTAMMRRTTAALVLATILYERKLRDRIVTWGATAEEAGVRLPGDELLENADRVATRAITIDAPASAVWPWLAQMGPSPRGGAYTYDWIENLLGLNMHSSDRVLFEYQHPVVGDSLGYGSNTMIYRLVEHEHVLALQSADGNWVWAFVLREQDGKTRLVSRNRFRLPKLKDKIGMLPMEPASLVMERKMLLGIKERAERLANDRKTAVHV